MKLKKLLVILLCIIMVVMSFAACGSNEKAAAPAPDTTEQTPAVDESNAVADAAMAYFANFPADRHMIEPADFFAKIDSGEKMFVIDVRKAEDYAKGHIKGAVNLPFGNEAVAKNLEIIPDDIPVYVYCYTGQTASQTTAVLNVAGKPATNVRSGFVLGISATPGYEKYVDTEAVALPTDTYAVDSDLKAAVDSYFATVASYAGTPTEFQNMTPETVKEILDSGSDEYMLVSVRQAEDFAKGHIKGAVNIPFAAGMQDTLANLPKDKKIIVNCYTGQTASQTVGILRLMGYEAYNMQFGMGSAETQKGWLGAGYETVTD